MDLRGRIFPPGPPRDGLIVRTEFVGSWESQFRGLGRLTAFLSEYLPRLSAAVDDIALNLVFLQRHRIEVGLKLVTERAGGIVPTKSHDISLAKRVAHESLRSCGRGDLADDLAETTGEFVDLMHTVDERSIAYRYPVDSENRPLAREPYIDLAELEAAGAAFHEAVSTTLEALTVSVPVPVSDEDVEATVDEAAATVRAIRTVLAVTESMYDALSEQGEKVEHLVGRRRLGPTAKGAEARSAADEQTKVLGALEPQLLVLLRRLESRRPPSAAHLSLA